MYKYKIVLNGKGGYFFSSFIKKEIGDYWLEYKGKELFEEYISSQYNEDDKIDDDWRIPEKYRFDIFNNLNSICLWETDSIVFNQSTICDIYKCDKSLNNTSNFEIESDFSRETLIESFLLTDKLIMNSEAHTWNKIIKDLLKEKNYQNAYIIYFKTSARGYATHEGLLEIKDEFVLNDLKFHVSTLGSYEDQEKVIKKAFYMPNTIYEKVLYDFCMLQGSREKQDFNFIGFQKASIACDTFTLNWVKDK